MKILVVSLLRLGDFIQIVPVIHGLKRKHGAKADVLTFKGSAGLKDLCEDVGQWHTLDRDELQRGLGTAATPMLTSFGVLRETLEATSACEYDLIVNVTQTHFSGYVMGYLRAKSKLGLAYNTRHQAHFHSPWFRYLDQHAEAAVDDVFNYTDVYCEGAGLHGDERRFALKSTATGHAEVRQLGLGPEAKMVCQVFTSDSKKNWGELAWFEFLTRVHRLRPALQIVLLGAPSETEAITKLQQRLHATGTRVEQAILSLDGALSLLGQAEILVSGDTSIKHLANATDVKVLELCLGSSDYRRTGVYKENSLILTSGAQCAPCPHSAPCSQAQHTCALGLSPAAVADITNRFLSGD